MEHQNQSEKAVESLELRWHDIQHELVEPSSRIGEGGFGHVYKGMLLKQVKKQMNHTGNNESNDDNVLYPVNMVALDFNRIKIYQVLETATGCNLNRYEEEPFCLDKRKRTVQRVSSSVTTTIVFLWVICDFCSHSSVITVQPLRNVFTWSPLLEPFGFMVFIWAIATMIVVGAPFSRFHSAMLMFWSILMLLRSSKSLTALYLPMLGIIFTGWYMLVEKQPPHHVKKLSSPQHNTTLHCTFHCGPYEGE